VPAIKLASTVFLPQGIWVDLCHERGFIGCVAGNKGMAGRVDTKVITHQSRTHRLEFILKIADCSVGTARTTYRTADRDDAIATSSDY
jgi:hypothetical protein